MARRRESDRRLLDAAKAHVIVAAIGDVLRAVVDARRDTPGI
ncbi:hypothetical protein WMF18_18695 [Sorangium sp. So ce315]